MKFEVGPQGAITIATCPTGDRATVAGGDLPDGSPQIPAAYCGFGIRHCRVTADVLGCPREFDVASRASRDPWRAVRNFIPPPRYWVT